MMNRNNRNNNQRQQPQRQRRRRRRARPLQRPAPPIRSVRAPVARGAIVTNNARGITVQHREYFADLTADGSGGFLASAQPITPVNRDIFPWLSAIAERYESFHFKRLSFEYVPICPTTTTGNAMMAIEYDVSDPAPATKQQMLTYQGAKQGPAWQRNRLDANNPNLNVYNKYFVGAAGRLGSVGQFIAAQSDAPAAITLGSLFVSYVVDLTTPQMNVIPGYQKWDLTLAATANTGLNSVSATETHDGAPAFTYRAENATNGAYECNVSGTYAVSGNFYLSNPAASITSGIDVTVSGGGFVDSTTTISADGSLASITGHVSLDKGQDFKFEPAVIASPVGNIVGTWRFWLVSNDAAYISGVAL